MSDRFKLVLFDLDGTLLDSAPDVHACINLTLEKMALPTLSMEEAKQAIGPGADNFSRVVLSPQARHRLEEFLTQFRPIYRQGCLIKTQPFPGIVELLQSLAGIDLAVVTNKSLPTAGFILAGLELARFFKLVVGPESVARIKPAPDMILHCLEHFHCRPEEAIMVGDTDNDVLAARSAGVAVCAAGWGYARQEELLALMPDYYAETPEGLKRILIEIEPVKAAG